MPPVVAAVAAILVEVGVGAATAATIATIVVNIALSVAISLVATLFAPGSPKQPAPHASRENYRNPVAPRIKYIGRVKVGGVLALLRTAPIIDRGETVNGLFVAVAQAQGMFERQEEIWLAEGKVDLDGGDLVHQPLNYFWEGIGWVRLDVRNGTDTQTAVDVLTEGLPGQWTSDFRGLGVPYIAARLKSPDIANFTKVYPSGLPAMSTVARTSPVWDPRDPNQSYDDPSTWRYSANAILCLLHLCLDADCLGLDFDMVNAGIDVWSMEADYCDIWRPLKNGGSEPWFRLAGGFQLTDPPKTWLQNVLDPMDARLILRADGAVVPSVGRWRNPELRITDDDIISYTGFARGKPKAQIKNRIDSTFIGPDYDYIQQQADPFLNEDSIDVDGLQSVTMDLDFAPSHAQARVRMKIELERQDPSGWAGTVVTKAYGMKFLTPNSDGSPKRFVHFVITELGVDGDFEVVTFAQDAKTGNCTFGISTLTSDAFDWDAETDEGIAPEFPRDTASNNIENPHNLQISVSGTTITATIDTPLTPLTANFGIVMDYRLTADGISDDEATWVPMSLSGETGTAGGLPDGRYDVRARLVETEEEGFFFDPTLTQLFSDTRAIRGIVIGNGEPATIGSAPSSFTVTDCGGNTVQVAITAPSTINVVGVKVWAAPGSSFSFAMASVVGTYDLTSGASLLEFIDMGAAGTFTFAATATDILNTGDSAPTGSTTVSVSGGTFVDPAGLPSAPTGLAATATHHSNITLDWDDNPGGDSVTQYDVYVGSGDVGFGQCSLISSPSASTYRVTGLQPETVYSVYIVADNANGSSDPSDVLVVTTNALSVYRALTVSAGLLALHDNDTWVDITNSTGAALTINLAEYPIEGQRIVLTDAGGDIGTHNWTVKDFGGTTIQTVSATGAVFGWTGTAWRIDGGSET